MSNCPSCGRAFGVKRRCYFCKPGRKRSRVARVCGTCGKHFEVWASTAADTTRNSGTYCSIECKAEAQKGRAQTWHDPTAKVMHSSGYVLVWMPSHPRSSRGRVLEHIVVMEEKIGRMLKTGERVHHIDHDRKNNHPDNLYLFSSNSEHSRHHAEQRRIAASTGRQ
jgi:hypothetical protein